MFLKLFFSLLLPVSREIILKSRRGLFLSKSSHEARLTAAYRAYKNHQQKELHFRKNSKKGVKYYFLFF